MNELAVKKGYQPKESTISKIRIAMCPTPGFEGFVYFRGSWHCSSPIKSYLVRMGFIERIGSFSQFLRQHGTDWKTYYGNRILPKKRIPVPPNTHVYKVLKEPSEWH